VLSAPPAFVLSQDQTLHELNSSFERTRLCSFGIFTFTSRYISGREGRVAFGLLRHGAPVLALPKTRVVNPPVRTVDPLFPSRQTSQFHPAAASYPPRSSEPFKLTPSGHPVKGPRSRSFSLLLRPPFLQRLQAKPLNRLRSRGRFRDFPSTASAAFHSSDSLISYHPLPAASTPVPLPSPVGAAKGADYKRVFSPRQPFRR
jgi:hypothetical protein